MGGKLRRSSDLIGSLTADLSQIKVEDGSILVLRSDRDWKDAEMQRLQEEVNQSLPHDAHCLLLVMRTDEAFETIPRPAAEAIYKELKKFFEPDAVSLALIEKVILQSVGRADERTFLQAIFAELRKPLEEKKDGNGTQDKPTTPS